MCQLSFYGTYGTGIVPMVKNIQIELGQTASQYEIGREEVCSVDSDGTVENIFASGAKITLSVSDPDVTVSLTYNRDLIQAIQRLESALITTGGEEV